MSPKPDTDTKMIQALAPLVGYGYAVGLPELPARWNPLERWSDTGTLLDAAARKGYAVVICISEGAAARARSPQGRAVTVRNASARRAVVTAIYEAGRAA